MATITNTNPSIERFQRVYAIRVPANLQEQIEAAAARDANTLSGVIRRLIMIGLRAEQQEAEPRGR